MRLLLDTSYADQGASGTAVYVERLAEALRGLEAVELIEERQPWRLRRGGRNPLRSALNAALDLLWLHRGLPRAATHLVQLVREGDKLSWKSIGYDDRDATYDK